MEGRKLAGTILSVSCRTLIFVLMAMLLYFAGRKMFDFGKAVFYEQAMASANNAVEIEVVIPEDYTISEVADILKENGLISDTKVFMVQARLSDYYNKFVPGVYTLNNSMKPSEILAAISVAPENRTEG